MQNRILRCLFFSLCSLFVCESFSFFFQILFAISIKMQAFFYEMHAQTLKGSPSTAKQSNVHGE